MRMYTAKFREYSPIAIVLAVTSILLFWNLGDNALSHWDEAWYADISRTMLRTGDYFTPIWNGHQFFDKPPLFYWAGTLFMKLFGVNEWSIRAVSAAVGVGTVFVVYLFSERLFGNRRISIISSIILASTIVFLYRSRTGRGLKSNQGSLSLLTLANLHSSKKILHPTMSRFSFNPEIR